MIQFNFKATDHVADYSKEICNNSTDIQMCPACDNFCKYWNLSEDCYYSKAMYLFDNPATVIFSVFMSFWGKIQPKVS